VNAVGLFFAPHPPPSPRRTCLHSAVRRELTQMWILPSLACATSSHQSRRLSTEMMCR
jgi:hypothetical protein